MSKELDRAIKIVNASGNYEVKPVLPLAPAAKVPLATGLLDYFPDALAMVAEVSRVGNAQHNPGEPVVRWAREKSANHPDSLMRHFMKRGQTDTDGMPHSAKAAWRALALLQVELETNVTAMGKK